MNYAAITLASLASSLHCAAMCGGFAVVVGGLPRVGESPASARGRFVRGQLAWATGRATGYATLGALSGVLGHGISELGRVVGWSEVSRGWSLPELAAALAGATLVVLALRELVPRPSASRSASSLPTASASPRGPAASLVSLRTPSKRARRATLRRPRLAARLARSAADGSSLAAFLLGASAATLLCGLSWSFVVLASASGGLVEGAAVMLAFALGTVPATLSVAGLARGPLQRLVGWLARHGSPAATATLGPKLAAAALLGLGLFTLLGRTAHVPTVTSPDRPPTTCHTPSVSP